MEDTTTELIVTGPGKCTIRADVILNDLPDWLKQDIQMKIELYVINAEMLKSVFINAKSDTDFGNNVRTWSLTEAG